MKRQLCIIIATFLCVILTGCKSREGPPSEAPTWDDENPTFLRWEDTGYTPEKLQVQYSSNTIEVAEYHHASSIEIVPGGIYSRLYRTLGTFQTVSEVGDAYKSNMESIKEEVEGFELFKDLQVTTLSNGVQLGALDDTKTQSYSINYQTDGIVHVVYHVDFGNFTNAVLTPKDISENIQRYCGINVSEDDLLILYYELLGHAGVEGTYTSYASDVDSYNYFSVSVKDFGTSAEHWEAYASVAVGGEQ